MQSKESLPLRLFNKQKLQVFFRILDLNACKEDFMNRNPIIDNILIDNVSINFSNKFIFDT